MKKIYLQACILAGLALSFSSCDKWLDGVKQTNQVDDITVWQKAEYVDKNVNAFYTFLHKYGQFGTYQFEGSLTEGLTNTFKYGSVALENRAGSVNNYAMNPGVINPDGYLLNVWDQNKAYQNIKQTNQFLDLLKKYSKFTPEQNTLWEAQVRFFRAYIYFQLAKRHGSVLIWGGLPDVNDKARTPEKDTWDYIANELDFAAEHLPATWSGANSGRVTKGAALALKSRAMLYAERWQEAYDAAQAVQALGLYDLVSDYAQAWKGNNKESILQFDYNATTGPSHSFDQWYAPGTDYEYGSTGTPTQEMVEAYEDKSGNKVDWSPWHAGPTATRPPYEQLEPRFHATVIYNGSTWKGKVMDCSVGGPNGEFVEYRSMPYTFGKTTTGYFLRKLLEESHKDLKGLPSSQTWVELRFAEVLLNQCEAAYRLGKIADARSLLNRVRARVGLPPKSSSGDEFFKDYRNERMIELAYEGHLYWDMRRWELAHIEYNNYRCHGMKILNGTYEYIDCDKQDRKFIKKLYVFPIPSAEIRNNSLMEQFDEWK